MLRRNLFDNKDKQKMEKVCKILALSMMMTVLIVSPVFASESVTSKLNSLTTLVTDIITASGGIVLGWGVFEFASAYQSGDTSQQTMSLKRIIAGILMVVAPQVLALLK